MLTKLHIDGIAQCSHGNHITYQSTPSQWRSTGTVQCQCCGAGSLQGGSGSDFRIKMFSSFASIASLFRVVQSQNQESSAPAPAKKSRFRLRNEVEHILLFNRLNVFPISKAVFLTGARLCYLIIEIFILQYGPRTSLREKYWGKKVHIIVHLFI